MSTKSVIRYYQVPLMESDMEELKVRTKQAETKQALMVAIQRVLEGKQ